jgi:hypothetical protein
MARAGGLHPRSLPHQVAGPHADATLPVRMITKSRKGKRGILGWYDTGGTKCDAVRRGPGNEKASRNGRPTHGEMGEGALGVLG